MKKYVSASILSADFLDLKNEIKRVEESGSDMLHFDVMDGIFVKNISFGFPVLEAVKKCTDLCLDVHLMISEPLKYAARFAAAGADIITFHLESNDDPEAVIAEIRKNGVKTGLSVKPGTPFENTIPYLDKIDMLLIMTVEPGFGGQSYITEMNEKIRLAKKYIDENKLNTAIQVDGGINEITSAQASEAGANVLVAGNYIFKAPSMKEAVENIRK
ncbi:MAG: ribulose-phosphate 3-epimerase [Clostridium sp.]|nr:ribulose-phosphate 3-epimerase [Clostridium sp.]MCM1548170.1 ribulose-phosphate 3-epimerase [Ruminococcus sp.]